MSKIRCRATELASPSVFQNTARLMPERYLRTGFIYQIRKLKARELQGYGSRTILAPTQTIRWATRRLRSLVSGWGADDWLRALANNQRLASEIFGARFGVFDAGSPADLLILNYQAPTPLTSENLAWHLAFAMNSSSVESVMVNGRFVVRDRQAVFDDQYLADQARVATAKLWKKLQTL